MFIANIGVDVMTPKYQEYRVPENR
jgi:hypothetical protein